MPIKGRSLSTRESLILLRKTFRKLKIKIKIDFIKKSTDGIFICSVKSKSLFGYRGFGSGATKKEAVVGALGELFERFSSLLFFHYYLGDKIDTYLPYSILPKAKKSNELNEIFSLNSFMKKDFVDEIVSYIPHNLFSKTVFIPFRKFSEDIDFYLPINEIRKVVGSNGCATGATIIESQYYAFCEIFERELISCFLKNPERAECISNEYLNEENLILIDFFRKKGISIKLFDISIQNKIPGVLVMASDGKNVRIKIGVHSNLDICMRRVLNELIQVCFFNYKFTLKLPDYLIKENSEFDKSFSLSFYYLLELGYYCHPEKLKEINKKSDLSLWKPFEKINTHEEAIKLFLDYCNELNWSVYYYTFCKKFFYTSFIYIPQISGIFYKTKHFNDTLLHNMDLYLGKSNISLQKDLKKIFLSLNNQNYENLELAKKYLEIFIESPLVPGVVENWDWFSYIFNLNPEFEKLLLPEVMIELINEKERNPKNPNIPILFGRLKEIYNIKSQNIKKAEKILNKLLKAGFWS